MNDSHDDTAYTFAPTNDSWRPKVRDVKIELAPKPEFTDAERAEMFDKARNANMVTLAYFTQESRQQVIAIANVVTEARDVIDAQTVVDTLSAVLDDLQHQYHAALRKRDLFRTLEAK